MASGGAFGLAGFSVLAGGTAAAKSAPPPPPPIPASAYTVVVSQTTELTDGQPIQVKVTANDPSVYPVGLVYVTLCEGGVTYSSLSQLFTQNQVNLCGYSPGVSGANSQSQTANRTNGGTPDGTQSLPINFIAGVGTTALSNGAPQTFDSTHPGELVVAVFPKYYGFVQTSPNTPVYIDPVQLNYASATTVAGCTSLASDAVQTVSAERFDESYTDWARQACTTGGPGNATNPTDNVGLTAEGGSGGAVDQFANGDADLAYAAGGYGLPGFSEPAGRPYVAVPIAVNAVVPALSGGELTKAFGPKSANALGSTTFPTFQISTDVLANMYSQNFSAAALAELQVQNPEFLTPSRVGSIPLSSITYGSPPQAAGGATFPPQVEAAPASTSVFASTYFTDVAPQFWNSGATATGPGTPRGVISSFALQGAEPAFAQDGLYSYRSNLEKAVDYAAGVPYALQSSPEFILTDRATATQLGLTVGSLINDSSGVATAPTSATMDDALANYMTAEPDGTVEPNSAAANADPSAYPLTFVEYALAPTEPLISANVNATTGATTCVPRPASEQRMIQWLQFITGAGQTNMAPGLEPLTPALLATAKAAIAKIGTAAETGTCAAVAPTASGGAPTAAATGGSGFSGASGGFGGGPDSGTGLGDSSGVTSGGPTAVAISQPAVRSPQPKGQVLAAIQFPTIARRTTGWMLPAAALFILAFLTGGMALRTSGWSPIGLAGGWLRRRRQGPA